MGGVGGWGVIIWYRGFFRCHVQGFGVIPRQGINAIELGTHCMAGRELWLFLELGWGLLHFHTDSPHRACLGSTGTLTPPYEYGGYAAKGLSNPGIGPAIYYL